MRTARLDQIISVCLCILLLSTQVTIPAFRAKISHPNPGDKSYHQKTDKGTNSRLPKTDFSVKRATKTLSLCSHQNTTPKANTDRQHEPQKHCASAPPNTRLTPKNLFLAKPSHLITATKPPPALDS